MLGVDGASGQEISEGTRVRVTSAQPSRVLKGVFQGVLDDAIVVTLPNKGSIQIPRAQVVKLEVSKAPGRKVRGALIGAAVGAGVAFLLAVATTHEDSFIFNSVGQNTMLGSIFLVPTGAGVGALVAPGARWRSVPLETLTAVRTNNPQVGLNVSLRF
jgi:hypothetical protein